MAEKSVNLTVTEFLILMSLKKVSSVCSLFAEDEKDYSQRDINEALFRMGRKGIVEKGDNGVRIKNSVDELLNKIIDADSIVLISTKDSAIPEQCVYIGKELVLLRFDGNESRRVHIRNMEKSNLIQAVMDCGFIMNNNASKLIIGDGRIENNDESDKSLFEQDKNHIFSRENTKAVAMKYRINDMQKISQITLLSKGLEDYIIYDSNNENTTYVYSDDILVNLLGNVLS